MKQYRAALFVFVVPALLAVAGLVQLVREDDSAMTQARFVPMAPDERVHEQPPLEALRALLRRSDSPADELKVSSALRPARGAVPPEPNLPRN
jgi:hypothetical protein